MRIESITARAIPDTRGKPTIETTVSYDGLLATASVPSGKSVGRHEAVELRDENGGVARALQNVTGEIADALVGRGFDSLDALDAFLVELDGTPNKARLGANALLSVSIAAMRLSALQDGVPLWQAVARRAGTTPGAPRLFVNVLNGGAHANFHLPFQEYLIVAEGNLSEAFPRVEQVFTALKERFPEVRIGDEGGYAPSFDTIEKPFEILADITAGYSGMTLALDAAASEFFDNGSYHILGTMYSSDELMNLYEKLISQFPLTSIEDPFDENAHEDFRRFCTKTGARALVVGDDLTVTNPVMVADAIGRKEITAVLIKPNQVGTVREAILAVQETADAGLKSIASHRSGETADTFIADFAYGVGAYGLKAGGLAQRERLVKYERLLAIEKEATV